jgi:hypothetical protein
MWSLSPHGSRPGSARVSKPSPAASSATYRAAVAAAASQLKHSNSFPLPGTSGFSGATSSTAFGGGGNSNQAMYDQREGSEASIASINSDDLQNLSNLVGFDGSGNLDKDEDIWGSFL